MDVIEARLMAKLSFAGAGIVLGVNALTAICGLDRGHTHSVCRCCGLVRLADR